MMSLIPTLKAQCEAFIQDLNTRFNLKLTKRDFGDWFYKLESTVIHGVQLEED